MIYLKLFQTEQERISCEDTYEYVSYTVETDKVHMPEKPFFCKLTLNNSEVIEIEGSGELTSAMISQYKSTTINVKIGNLCTSIGEEAFTSCTSLTSITIPDSVTSIDDYAFVECTSLPIVDNIRYADTYAIEATDETLTTYTIKDGTRFIGGGAFDGYTSLTSITIPDSVISIGDSAFYRCSGLTSINIPNGVTSIGDFAFYNCSGLTSIDLPSGVTSIGSNAFFGCRGLTSITIPSGVTSIDEYLFRNCTSLSSITIPNSITSIGQSAFSSCKSLTSITIPNSVTSIGNSAFINCSGLISITSLATTAPTITSSTFQNVKTNGTLYVPSGSSGYDTWMGVGQYYLGYFNWTKVEQ